MEQANRQSTLVSAIGWIMLIAGLLGVVGLGLNMVFLGLDEQGGGGVSLTPDGVPEMPPLFFRILERLWLILGLAWASCLVMGLAGLGVVRRREWGRLLSILLLAISVLVGFVGAYASLGADAATMDGAMIPRPVSIVLNTGLALLTAALHGWLIWKLNTPAVRAEFKKVP